jgi:hypothetical protein
MVITQSKFGPELNQVHLLALKTASVDSLTSVRLQGEVDSLRRELQELRKAFAQFKRQDSVASQVSVEEKAKRLRQIDSLAVFVQGLKAENRQTIWSIGAPWGLHVAWQKNPQPALIVDTTWDLRQKQAAAWEAYLRQEDAGFKGYGWLDFGFESWDWNAATDLSLMLGRGWSYGLRGGLEGFWMETGAGVRFLKAYCDPENPTDCSERSNAIGPLYETMTLDHRFEFGWVVMRQTFSPHSWPPFWDRLFVRPSFGVSQSVGLFTSSSEGYDVARLAMKNHFGDRAVELWAWDYQFGLRLAMAF